jgi:mono/diheme cytochrome c family protein
MTKHRTVWLFWLIVFQLPAYAAERDPLALRVPPGQIAAARAWKNPYEATAVNIAKGKELFQGKATCFTCHGKEGRGDGPPGAELDPSPRNFHNPKFDRVKTQGEMMWVIKNGSPGTGMVSYVPGVITEDEAALVILYERSLGDQP